MTSISEDHNAILVKIEALREKLILIDSKEKLAKSLIPVHEHRPAVRTSGGVEDVPYGQVNPKGVDKKEKAMKSEKCAKCGEMHQDIKKCGAVMAKSSVKKTTETPSEWKDAKVELPGSKIKKYIWPADGVMAKTKKAMAAGNDSGAPSTAVDQLGKAVPVAKPPSGVSMTKLPTSKPAMAKPSMAKVLTNMTTAARSSDIAKDQVTDVMGNNNMAMSKVADMTSRAQAKIEASEKPAPKVKEMKKGIFSDAARNSDPMVASHAAHVAGQKPAAAPKKMPTPEQHASRAADFDAALGGAFQPKATPAAAKPQGLKSPKAAGVVASKPVMNAARPAKPGIFASIGHLLGGK